MRASRHSRTDGRSAHEEAGKGTVTADQAAQNRPAKETTLIGSASLFDTIPILKGKMTPQPTITLVALATVLDEGS